MQFDASFESGNLAEARLVTEMPCVPPSFPHPPRHPPLCPGGPSALCAGSSTTFTSGPIRSTRAIACGSTSRCAARRAARRCRPHAHAHAPQEHSHAYAHAHAHAHAHVRPPQVIFNVIGYSKTKSLYRDGMAPVVSTSARPHLRRADSAVLMAPQLATLASRGGSQARGCATHSGRAAEPQCPKGGLPIAAVQRGRRRRLRVVSRPQALGANARELTPTRTLTPTLTLTLTLTPTRDSERMPES